MKRKAVQIALPLTLLLSLFAGGAYLNLQPRCCLTYANARLWQHFGYFSGLNARQVEDAIYLRCAAIGCQMQDGGGCPSQWGVEEVAASFGLPPYVNPPRWDWAAALENVRAQTSIIFFWSGPDYAGPDGLMHAYWCNTYEEPRTQGGAGRLWCVDALNQLGRWWNEAEVQEHWSGWSAGIMP